MEIEHAIDVLDKIPSAVLFKERFMLLRSKPKAPSVLLLVSAPDAEVKNNFPASLIQCFGGLTRESPSQITRQADLSPDIIRDQVAETDLVIWIVSALDLYKSTFATALDTSRQLNIPVWIVMTGMSYLGNEREFRITDIPHFVHSLPNGSTSICEGDASPPDEMLHSRLATEGKALALRGWERKVSILGRNTIAFLRFERKRLLDLNDTISKALGVADGTFNACRVLKNSQVYLMKLKREQLREIEDTIRTSLLSVLENAIRQLATQELRSRCRDVLKEFGTNRLPLILENHNVAIAHYIEQWCADILPKLEEISGRVNIIIPKIAYQNMNIEVYFQFDKMIRELQPAQEKLITSIWDAMDELPDAWDESFLLSLWNVSSRQLVSSENDGDASADMATLMNQFVSQHARTTADFSSQSNMPEQSQSEQTDTPKNTPLRELQQGMNVLNSALKNPNVRQIVGQVTRETAPKMLYAQLSNRLNAKLEDFSKKIVAAFDAETVAINVILDEHLLAVETEMRNRYYAGVENIELEQTAVQKAEDFFLP